MGALFLAAYLLIALACVGFGLYLSYPGKSWLTLPGDALSVFHRRSQPAPVEPLPSVPHNEPTTPVDEHNAETLYHVVAPVIPPVADEGHESHAEAEPAEVIRDEP